MELIIIFLLFCIIVLGVVIMFSMRPKLSKQHDIKELLLENEQRQQEAMYTMQTSVTTQMQQFQQTMVQSIHQDMNRLNDTTTKRMFSLEEQVHHNLTYGYEKTSQVFGEVLEKMAHLDENQKNLKELSLSIGQIQNVLTDKKTRGIFGEIELYHLLENAMGLPGKQYAKQYTLSTRTIADAVLFAKDPLYMICIDSKFPLENYNRIMNSSVSDAKRSHAQFVQDVKKHIKTIADKYIIQNETAEFAYMFIPAEAIFAYIYASCDELVQFSYEQKVYMVSPTTLMAYITAIRAIYLGIERNDNIVEIQKELKLLKIEFERFEKRYESTQSDFERCYQDMQNLSITARKLIQRFKEIEAVELGIKQA